METVRWTAKMAKKSEVKPPNSFNLGDRVRIKDFAGQIGRIAELRGPLGPSGVSVYRVRLRRKPTSAYIEVLGDQLECLPVTAPLLPKKRHKASPKARNVGGDR